MLINDMSRGICSCYSVASKKTKKLTKSRKLKKSNREKKTEQTY